jgi:hypothetical protein
VRGLLEHFRVTWEVSAQDQQEFLGVQGLVTNHGAAKAV